MSDPSTTDHPSADNRPRKSGKPKEQPWLMPIPGGFVVSIPLEGLWEQYLCLLRTGKLKEEVVAESAAALEVLDAERAPAEAQEAINCAAQAGMITSPIEEVFKLAANKVLSVTRNKSPISPGGILLGLPLLLLYAVVVFVGGILVGAYLAAPAYGAVVLGQMSPAFRKFLLQLYREQPVVQRVIWSVVLYFPCMIIGIFAALLYLFPKYALMSALNPKPDWVFVTSDRFIFYSGTQKVAFCLPKDQPLYGNEPSPTALILGGVVCFMFFVLPVIPYIIVMMILRGQFRGNFVTSCTAKEQVLTCELCSVNLPRTWAERHNISRVPPPPEKEFWNTVRQNASAPHDSPTEAIVLDG